MLLTTSGRSRMSSFARRRLTPLKADVTCHRSPHLGKCQGLHMLVEKVVSYLTSEAEPPKKSAHFRLHACASSQTAQTWA